MSRFKGRMRPAGESSDEDEFADYLSDGNEKPLLKNNSVINIEQRENDRIYQIFLRGNLNEIIELLDGGFDVNKSIRDDWTPLLLAAATGTPEVTNELIKRGANVNKHRDHYTPLMAAAACPLLTSSYENSLLVVQQLLKHQADINAKTRKRMTALMFAASIGNCAIVKELLPHCDKGAQDNQGWTALFWAVNGNNEDVVKFLLEEGFTCDTFDVRGNLPIHYARENGYNKIMDLLPSLHDEDENSCIFNELGYQDFFDYGQTCFVQDVAVMLYGMKNERNIEKFLNKNIDLLTFLALDEEYLKNIDIKMPYERYRILGGLYKFHKHPFRTKALPIVGKSEEYSTLNVANTILSSCRQFIVMQGSLRYILRNTKDLSEFNGFDEDLQKIKESLKKIKDVVTKINKQAVEWDNQTKPADIITKDSCNKLKTSKLKYFCIINILSIIAYVTWKKLN